MRMLVGRVIAVALLAGLSAYLLACGGSGSSGEGSGSETPAMQRLDEASLNGVRSGYFEALFFLDNETAEEAVQWRALGPFLRSGNGALAANVRFEHAGTYGGTNLEARGHLLVLGNQTLLRNGAGAYRLPRSSSGQTAEISAGCQRALEATDFGTLVRNLKIKPEPQSEVTVIEGHFRLPPLFDALHRLMAPSACGELVLGTAASPQAMSALETQIKRTFKKSVVTFTIDKDHVLTGISLGIWVESPPPRPEEIDGTLTVSLTRVDEIAAIRKSPAARSTFAGAREPPAEQLRRVGAWVSLVVAAVKALEGP